MVVDACAAAATPTHVASTRLPAWLLPTTTEEDRRKMRPDLLIIPTLDLAAVAQGRHPQNPEEWATHTVHILEVGYVADTRHEQKQQEKLAQHQRLVEALQAEGWQVKFSTPEAVSLGYTGTIHKNLPLLLSQLGNSAEQVNACCNDLHALHWTSVINTHRRQRERKPMHRDGRPP